MIQTPKLSPICNRFVSLLPNFSWANAKDIWNSMISKEQFHTRNPLMISRHSNLQPRMRSILLNWLSEVSEVYKLHRETYYLAIDYFDRYLSIQNGLDKQQLQLIGITCLFVAAKVGEIYPPKACDFAYVTDGACTERQILTKELVILKCLEWNLNSMTVNSWLTIYMQLYTIFEKEKTKLTNQQLINPQQRLSPCKNQPPKKKRKTALNSSPVLQLADTNKQVETIKKEQIDPKVDSEDEKQLNLNNNLNNMNKKPLKKDDEIKKEIKEPTKDLNKELTKLNSTSPDKSFITTNIKLLIDDHEEDEFMYQKYDSYFYAQIAHLVDLSMLDIGSLKFSYNVISASALYHFTSMPVVMQCTGLRIDQIQECILWMTPFALAIRDEGFDLLKLQKNLLIEKMPNIQAHTVDLKLLDKAQLKFQQVLAERNGNNLDKSANNSDENDSSAKPASLSSPLKSCSTILTPPRSASKQSKKA